MFKTRKFMNYQKKELSPDLTPLIDVVFLLLIFFMVASTFDKKGGIKLDLPEANSTEIKALNENISVLVFKDFQIALQVEKEGKIIKENISRENLFNKIKDKIKFSKEKNVFVVADKGLNYGEIVEIISDIKKAGASSISLETKRKESNEN